MNKGILTIGIILLALIALNLLNVLNNYSTGSELDYYLLKETTDAAMVDAIDKSYLRTCGLYRIDKEKFVESFLYRFASNIDASRGYTVGFYDINEVPPKVSIKIDSLTTLSFNTGTGAEGNKEAANISTSYDAILESNYLTDTQTEIGLNTDDDMCKDLNKITRK
ncbi:MAG: hypothetical protein IJG68_01055 [Bacilli bacterium]|nr:hypothetical protein [Bacilli bacterium]